MAHLVLSGLHGDQPIGIMAALGLLRLSTGQSELGQVKLAWDVDNTCTAMMHTEKPCTEEALLSLVLSNLQDRSSFPPFHGQRFPSTPTKWDDIKVKPDEFGQLLSDTRDAADLNNREAIDFLAACGSELTTAPSTGDVKPTAFHMTAGQQKLLKSLRELSASLDPTKHPKRRSPNDWMDELSNAFHQTLFEEWQYKDNYHSLGWDPNTEALYALAAIAPTDAGPRSERAAVWLAAESLSLFPCFPTPKNRLHTRGFNRFGSEFRWPIWTYPISLDTVKSLLGFPELYAKTPNRQAMQCLGVARVYKSARPTDANGRGIFRPAVLVPLQ